MLKAEEDNEVFIDIIRLNDETGNLEHISGPITLADLDKPIDPRRVRIMATANELASFASNQLAAAIKALSLGQQAGAAPALEPSPPRHLK